jgi:hypothetical protein
MKTLLKFMGTALIITVLYFGYQLSTFTLFDENDIRKIADIEFADKIYRLYYIPSNATSQSYIQVRRVLDNSEDVVKSFERYNYVNDYRLMNDTLRLILSDTISYAPRADTLFVELKDKE